MQHIEQQPHSERAGTQTVRAYFRGLEGVSGAMRIETPQGTLGTLFVDDGNAEYVPGRREGTVVAFFEDSKDVRPLLRGEINPVVGGLQRRVLLDGDRALGVRIMLGLRTGASTKE